MEILMELLSEYVVMVVMAICLAIGYIIKHSVKVIPNDYIPAIMGVLGIILNCWVNDFSISPTILLGGLASGLASTGAFELVKNLISRGGGNAENK